MFDSSPKDHHLNTNSLRPKLAEDSEASAQMSSTMIEGLLMGKTSV